MARLYSEPKISPANPTSSDMALDWCVWFRIVDPVTGKHIKKTYKSGINRYHVYRERLAEANALRLALKEELAAGWNPLVTDQVITIYSIEEALNYVLNLKKKTIRMKSFRTYKSITELLKQWLKSRGELTISTASFTPMMAQAYMDHLMVKRNYSARTHNDHLTILSTFFNAFIEREWVTKNPFKAVKKKQTTIGRNLAYSDAERDQLKALLKQKDLWMYYFSQIMYYCFIRRTEMTKLKIADFDLVNHTIILRAEVSKNKSQESVVIPKGLEPIIREMKLRHYPGEFYLFGRHLFPGDQPYVNPDHISARHNKFVRQLGLDKEKGLYSWKHTGVCAAYYATGKDLYSVMRQLRHRDLNTTSIYLKSLGLIQNDVFRDAMSA